MKHHLPEEEYSPSLRRRLFTLACVFIGIFVIGCLTIPFWPKRKTARATLVVSPQEDAANLTHSPSVQFGTRSFLRREASLIGSKRFLTKVAGQNGLANWWGTTNSKASVIMKRRTAVKTRSKNRIEIRYSSENKHESVEMVNMIAQAYMSHWRSLHDDRFNDLILSMESDHKRFKNAVAMKIAAYEVLSQEEGVERDEIEAAKTELTELKKKNAQFIANLKELKLEKAIVASAARFQEEASIASVSSGVATRAGLNFLSLISLFGTIIAAGWIFRPKRGPKNKLLSLKEIAKQVPANELALIPQHLENATPSFESIRDQIFQKCPSPEGYTVAFVPCLIDEDASPVSTKLAEILADTGHPTLLIEGNLRQPRIHDHFGAAPIPGFAELLAGEMELHETVVKSKHQNLWLLPGGSPSPDAAALFKSEQKSTVMEDISSRFDFIIFNGGPLLGGIDSLLIIEAADTTFLCPEKENVSSSMLESSRNAVVAAGGSFGGLVLTEVGSEEMKAAGKSKLVKTGAQK